MDKYGILKEILKKQGKVAVAFSGGIDSTFLLDTAIKTLGRENVLALSVISPFLPKQDLRDIESYYNETGIENIIINMDYSMIPEIRNNPRNRCYYCKKEMFRRMKKAAKEKGFDYLIDGTNADDAKKYRPGLKAKEEEQIKSPLSEAGINKAEIRTLSSKYGVPFAKKPSSSCLATRIPYNTKITMAALRRIDMAEEGLKTLGFSILRVRDHGKKAIVELGEKDHELLKNISSNDILKVLKSVGYMEYFIESSPYESGKNDEKLIKNL